MPNVCVSALHYEAIPLGVVELLLEKVRLAMKAVYETKPCRQGERSS